MHVSTFNRLIKLRRTLFGMPLTLAGALLPFALGIASSMAWHQWVFIVAAFTGARTAGMAFNEWIDRHIDAANPRTWHRVLPMGEASAFDVACIAWGGLLIYFLSCALINTTVLYLSPIAALLIATYSFTKRFTSWCHIVLGVIQFFGPLMAWAAVTGEVSWKAAAIGGVALTLIAANDMIYSLQDVSFDREKGLFSLPSRYGERATLWIARTLHVVTLLLLASLIPTLPLIYAAGVVLSGGAIIISHLRLRVEKDAMAVFARCNTWVSLLTLFSVLGALLWRLLF